MDVRFGFPLKPGKCFVCGTPDGQQWTVDLGKEDPNEVQLSRVYVCTTCTIAAAKALGAQAGYVVLTDDQYDELRHESGDDGLKQRLAAAHAHNEELIELALKGRDL